MSHRNQRGGGPVTLYDHQQRVVDDFALRGCLSKLCIHSTGSGKTLIAAALVRELRPRSTLVLTKKSAISQFSDEIGRMVVSATRRAAVVVTTHHTFWRHEAAAAASRLRGPAGASDASSLLVVDEAHEFSNPDTSAHSNLERLIRKFTHVLFLTATPITNKVEDLLVLVSLLRRERFVKGSRAEASEDPVEERKRLLRPALFVDPRTRRWLVDVHLVDKSKDARFPRTTAHRVPIPMSKSTSQEYDRQLQRVAPFYVNLRQLSLGFGKACEKCRWLVGRCKEWIARGEGKIVVYTAYIDRGSRVIRRALLDAGINTLVITGETSGKERRNAAVLFNRRPADEVLSVDMRREVGPSIRSTGSTSDPRSSVRCRRLMLTRKIVGPTSRLRSTPRTSSAGKKGAFEYSYSRPDGTPASHEEIEYAKALKIPPPWTPAEICAPNKKLLWVAKDMQGKWQYRYSSHWAAQQEFKKMLRLKLLDAKSFGRIQDRIRSDLDSPRSDPTTFQCALVVRLMSVCHFRVGGRKGGGREEEGDDTTATFGVTTMLKKHIALEGNSRADIKFLGKARKWNACGFRCAPTVRFLRRQARSTPKQYPYMFTVRAPAVRAYLRGLMGPGSAITPKDFRTYAANLTVLESLASTNPLATKPSARRRAVGDAIRLAAKGLNNTPAVAKSSYVFPGFWVLYLANPVRFRELATGDRHVILDRFVAEFADKQLDWRLMLEWFQNTKGLLPFLGPVQVLLISDAGSESIDLAGTRHIVFLDPTWTPALEDQIVGRGQRSQSHAFLSPSRRTLDVWKLSLQKARGGAERKARDSNLIHSSIDEFVYFMAATKRKVFDDTYDYLGRMTKKGAS